jgi:hypothetical protein
MVMVGGLRPDEHEAVARWNAKQEQEILARCLVDAEFCQRCAENRYGRGAE